MGLTGCARFDGEGCYISAFDIHTGARAWRFYTIPREGQTGSDTWGKLPMPLASCHSWRVASSLGTITCGHASPSDLHVFFAADHQRSRFDLRPVVHDRIEIGDLLVDGADHGEARPVAAEGWGVVDRVPILGLSDFITERAGAESPGLPRYPQHRA